MQAVQQNTDDSYYNQINFQLADAVHAVSPQHVLEVGCGAGSLGRFLKSQLPGLRWDGIEPYQDAAKLAGQSLDRVFHGCLEEVDLEPLVATYDTIVLGDVIEHLLDPWAALARRQKILKRRGRIVLSVPNINHWSIFFTLLSGRFPYSHSGLLDRTHLRFFTLHEIKQSLMQTNLQIERVRVVSQPHTLMNSTIEKIVGLQEDLGLNNPSLRSELEAFQWIVTARK